MRALAFDKELKEWNDSVDFEFNASAVRNDLDANGHITCNLVEGDNHAKKMKDIDPGVTPLHL